MASMPGNISMLKVFDSKVRHLETHFASRLRELDNVLTPWDPALTDHSVLLNTATALKGDMAQWKRSLLQLMASLWLEQKKTYNAYRRRVEVVLRKRHLCELEALFANLRYQAEGNEAKGVSYTQSQIVLKSHLAEAGYRYNQHDLYLNKVAKRQVAEKASLEGITKKHVAFLDEAAERDATRLTMSLNRALDTGNRILTLVEQKVSMAHQASTTPNLYKKFQLAKQEPQRKESTAAPPPPDAAPAAAPTGSAMDNFNRSRDGSQVSNKDGEGSENPSPRPP